MVKSNLWFGEIFVLAYKGEIKSVHTRASGFHREAISPRAAGFHPSVRTDFVEKSPMRSIRLFSGGGGRIRLHFSSPAGKKNKGVAAAQPAASDSPPDCRMWDLRIRPPFLPPQKTAILADSGYLWWGRTDSNHRSETQQIYSLSPLATRELPRICGYVLKTWLL